jgi:hypothetical protein
MENASSVLTPGLTRRQLPRCLPLGAITLASRPGAENLLTESTPLRDGRRGPNHARRPRQFSGPVRKSYPSLRFCTLQQALHIAASRKELLGLAAPKY